MKYEIFGGEFPGVKFNLEPGEAIVSQAGGMAWMDPSIQMETRVPGGIGGAFGRMLTGEGIAMNVYTSHRPNSEIVFASTIPGRILPVELSGESILAQKTAFMCATRGVQMRAEVTNVKAGFFGGEGFLLQRISGNGTVFLECSGSVVCKDLAPGETLLVDTGSLVAFEETVRYDIERVKGVKNIFLGGEGLFLTKMTGPGQVYLQTMSVSNLAAAIIPYLPTSNR